MYSFKTQYRVRYADVDQMGYMYYGNYARLFEIGRVEAIRNLGVIYKELEEEGIWMPVYENYSRFIGPARYDELLTIVPIINELPKTRIIFDTEIYNENNELIHRGKTTLVFIKAETGKITLCPQNIIERLRPFFK